MKWLLLVFLVILPLRAECECVEIYPDERPLNYRYIPVRTFLCDDRAIITSPFGMIVCWATLQKELKVYGEDGEPMTVDDDLRKLLYFILIRNGLPL